MTDGLQWTGAPVWRTVQQVCADHIARAAAMRETHYSDRLAEAAGDPMNTREEAVLLAQQALSARIFESWLPIYELVKKKSPKSVERIRRARCVDALFFALAPDGFGTPNVEKSGQKAAACEDPIEYPDGMSNEAKRIYGAKDAEAIPAIRTASIGVCWELYKAGPRTFKSRRAVKYRLGEILEPGDRVLVCGKLRVIAGVSRMRRYWRLRLQELDGTPVRGIYAHQNVDFVRSGIKR